MKNRDIFTLLGLGIIAWFFLKPKMARAEEAIKEIPEPSIIVPSFTEEEVKRIITERPCYLTDYPCIQWYRTQYKVYI